MAGSSVLVVLNSLRLERMPKPVRTPLSGGQPSGEAQSAPDTFSMMTGPGNHVEIVRENRSFRKNRFCARRPFARRSK
jgi:hypothetical protein